MAYGSRRTLGAGECIGRGGKAVSFRFRLRKDECINILEKKDRWSIFVHE